MGWRIYKQIFSKIYRSLQSALSISLKSVDNETLCRTIFKLIALKWNVCTHSMLVSLFILYFQHAVYNQKQRINNNLLDIGHEYALNSISLCVSDSYCYESYFPKYKTELDHSAYMIFHSTTHWNVYQIFEYIYCMCRCSKFCK